MILGEMIERNAARYGDTIAVRCEGRELTHRQLRDQAVKLGSALVKAGLVAQDRVAILSLNSIEFALAYAACELFGFIATTVNYRLAPPEIRHVLTDSGARALIFETDFASAIAEVRDHCPALEIAVVVGAAPEGMVAWDDFVAGGDAGAILPTVREEDTAYLIYTSGTTGKPKGCMLGQQRVCALAQTMTITMALSSQDHTLLMMPMFHIGAKAIALGQQWVGGTITLHRKFDPAAVLQAIHAEGVTATHMTPLMVQQLADAAQNDTYDLSGLRTLLYSAAAMPPAVLRRALDIFGPVFQQMYGQTEGIGTVLPQVAHRLDVHGVGGPKLASIGHAMLGSEISIRDESNAESPTGEVGEICLRGPAIMQGYWNNTAASLGALAGGWLHTGDMGYLDPDGFAWLVDRKKDMIISGGENVYSREVEDALMAHPAIELAAVIARPDAQWGEIVCACVVIRSGSTLDESAVVDHCRSQIAAYKRPRAVIFLRAMPLLANGKIDKNALRAAHGRVSRGE